jgi:glyoxylate/hydroxypyruvate reductase A
MAVLFSWKEGDVAVWMHELSDILGEVDLRVYPEVGTRGDIEHAVVWMHPAGDLKTYPNLKAIYSIGAGVSHILRDPALPDVPIVRLVDQTIERDMAGHLLHWVLHFHRHYHHYNEDQREARWARRRYLPNHQRTVGILGLGVLGQAAAAHFAALGYQVAGWSRGPKEVEGVACFSGRAGLESLLARSNFLVNLLPLTEETENLLDAKRLAQLPQDAFVINAGRGQTLVEADLIDALERGHIAGAALDVFPVEPMSPEHPFWRHPKIHVTPHAAAPSDQAASARCIAENIKRVRDGQAPFPVVDRSSGY